MRYVLVTGPTGVGKSMLLARLAAERGMLVVDPLASPPLPWIAPDPVACRGVAIDHAWWLDPYEYRDICAWCEVHGVDLWLAETARSDLEQKGMRLPVDTFEIKLAATGATSSVGSVIRGQADQMAGLVAAIA